ncbi:sugar phosphate isomerase/epimerase family protein [Actinomadura darangshiensis]|nr:TIM barrel protein [Actinomadura darangshiensis]
MGREQPDGLGFRCSVGGDRADPAVTRQLAAAQWLGWDAIDLHRAGGLPLADLPGHGFRRLADLLAAREVRVTCVDSGLTGWDRPDGGPFFEDLDRLRILAARCAVLGADRVRLARSVPSGTRAGDGTLDRYGLLGRLRILALRAAEAGLTLVYDHDGDGTLVPDLLDEVASPALRTLFDTGARLADGRDSYDDLRRAPERVGHVRVADGLPGLKTPVRTLPGDGICRVPECLSLLAEQGYGGSLSIGTGLPDRRPAGAGHPAEAVLHGRRLMRLIRTRERTRENS